MASKRRLRRVAYRTAYPWCRPARKRSYPDESSAQGVIADLCSRNDPNWTALRAYKCTAARDRHWHLTSQVGPLD
jgi:hypothetical protein